MSLRRCLFAGLAGLALVAGDGGAGQGLKVRERLAGSRAPAILGPLRESLPGEEREALAFLLVALPLGDLREGAGEALLKDVRASLLARSTVPWGRRIPEDLFRQYVLPPRVFTEPADTFREECHRELLARVKGLSMSQAALEMNLWGLSRVTYGESDSRVASRRGLMHSTEGSCLEEATLLAAALRAVAIPARLVLLPWWTHQDGRHAWVEAWVDGDWRVLGAMEPEPALDRAWFLDWGRRAPRFQAMVLGARDLSTGMAGLFGQDRTSRYAAVRTLEVEVVDREGRSIPGATVDLRAYSAAGLQLLQSCSADARGRATFRTGGGDLVAWARSGRAFGFRKVDARADRARVPLDGAGADLDLSPVPEPVPLPVPPKGDAAFSASVKEADRRREAVRADFLEERRALALAREADYAEEAAACLRGARGNWREILAFLRGARPRRQQALALLACLTPKDLREVTADVLLDHLPTADAPREALDPWVLTPRVDEEPLAADRVWFRANLPAELAAASRRDPESLVAWMRDRVRVDEAANPGGVPMPPRVVFSLGLADERGRDVLFVALCRSLGIPARLGGLTLLPEYRAEGRWRQARFDTDPGVGRLLLKGEPGLNLRHGVHYSLARIQDGRPRPMGFPAGLPLSALAGPMVLPAGDYLLVTGCRLEGGSVLARVTPIAVPRGGMVAVPVVQRRPPGPAPEMLAPRR